MVIPLRYWMPVSNHFWTKFITLGIRFIPAPRRLYFFVSLTLLDIMVCMQIRTHINKIPSSAYPHISTHVVFRPSFRLLSFFPFKDRVPCYLGSHVVYLYRCQCCGALYVGQTRRHMHTIDWKATYFGIYWKETF